MRIKSMLLAGLLAVPGLAVAQTGTQTQTDQPQAQQQTKSKAKKGQKHEQALQQFRGEDNYEIQGKISSVDQERVVITREQLPGVELMVPEGAQIRLDGQDVQIQQLQPGQEVRATFNLSEDTPLAIELEAERGEQQQQQQQEREGMQQPGQEQRDSPW